MAARSGVVHYRAGAHLPVGRDAISRDGEDIADPAKGATVARCLTCGMPDAPNRELATFVLVPVDDPGWIARLLAALRHERLYYRLCLDCVSHANRITPREADPLSVATA